jgi:hypothetical protein
VTFVPWSYDKFALPGAFRSPSSFSVGRMPAASPGRVVGLPFAPATPTCDVCPLSTHLAGAHSWSSAAAGGREASKGDHRPWPTTLTPAFRARD